jgi:dihydrofolate reductase/thymidylate synthase
MFRLSAVVAITPSGGIGYQGTLPWVSAGIRLPGDISYFKHVTSTTDDINKRNAVIMGRRTFESIPSQFKPLSNRVNVVITENPGWSYPNVETVTSLELAIDLLMNNDKYKDMIESGVIIGGVRLFEEVLFHPMCCSYHLTRINRDFPCDAYLSPKTIDRLKQLQAVTRTEEVEENGITY